MKLIFTLLILSMTYTGLFSQENKIDYLKHYSVLGVGNFDKNKKEDLGIRMFDKSEIKTAYGEISMLKSEGDNNFFYPGEDRGFYQGVNVRMMFSQNFIPRRGLPFQTGFGGQYSLGYQFNRNILTGTGIGASYYDGLTIIDIFGQIRYCLSSRSHHSLFIGLEAGYGLPIASSLLELKGGYSFRPSIGLRIGTRGNYNLLLEAGIQIQNVSYIENYTSGSWSKFNIVQLPTFVRVGYVFWKE